MTGTRHRLGSKLRGDVSRLQLALASTTESVNQAAAQIVRFARAQDYTKPQCQDLELAVREVVANAVFHGNQGDCNKKVFLTAERKAPGLVIRVRDEGSGFNRACVPDPLAPANLEQESGRGLLLIQASVDKVIWRHSTAGGTEVILTKTQHRLPTIQRKKVVRKRK
jgi:serine/threonine-protein kinase RsbW